MKLLSLSQFYAPSWASAEIFSGVGNIDILLILFRRRCKWTFTKRFESS